MGFPEDVIKEGTSFIHKITGKSNPLKNLKKCLSRKRILLTL